MVEPTAYQLAFERACVTEVTTVEREVDRDFPDEVFRLCVTLRTTGKKARVNVAHGTTEAGTYWVPVGPFVSPDWAAILFEMAHREATR